MSPPLRHSRYPIGTHLAAPAAGAEPGEPDPPEPVTVEGVRVVTQGDTAYSDAVEHERIMRLKRWQAIDPRERRP